MVPSSASSRPGRRRLLAAQEPGGQPAASRQPKERTEDGVYGCGQKAGAAAGGKLLAICRHVYGTAAPLTSLAVTGPSGAWLVHAACGLRLAGWGLRLSLGRPTASQQQPGSLAWAAKQQLHLHPHRHRHRALSPPRLATPPDPHCSRGRCPPHSPQPCPAPLPRPPATPAAAATATALATAGGPAHVPAHPRRPLVARPSTVQQSRPSSAACRPPARQHARSPAYALPLLPHEPPVAHCTLHARLPVPRPRPPSRPRRA